MNKRQTEVLQYLENREKRVLKELEAQYRGALEDINMSIQVMLTDEQTPSKVYRINHQKALRSQIEGIIERLHGKEYETIAEYLRDSYTDSFVGCMYDHAGQGIPLILPIDQNAAAKAIEIDSELSEDLYTSLGVDTQKLKKTIRQEITRGLATTMAFADISRNVANVAKAPLNRAKVIVKTEAHRIQEAARYDGMLLAKSKGAKEVKIWTSLGNSRVRDAHRELHGQIREVDKPFTYGTKKAMYPGDFGDPALDINCNCKGLTKATWLLDEITLKELEDQAAAWGLDKTKDFDDYKKKYLKAAEKEAPKPIKKAVEPLKKQEDNGKIESRNITSRTMANRNRTSPLRILTETEIQSVLTDADTLKIPREVLRFNGRAQTGFYEDEGLIYIRGDILPDKRSHELRDNLSERAVLAHEYYGHYLSHPSPFRIGDWRDEFMASYKAALNAPGLTDNERRMLMLDAYDRAKEAGVTVKYNKKARELIYGDE